MPSGIVTSTWEDGCNSLAVYSREDAISEFDPASPTARCGTSVLRYAWGELKVGDMLKLGMLNVFISIYFKKSYFWLRKEGND
jgi:hypothetical protein